MQDAFGVELGEVSKAAKKQKKASTGRLVTGALFPGYHGIAAGRKGHRLRAAGNELGGGIAGSLVGGAAGSALGMAATRNPMGGAVGAHFGAAGGSYVGGHLGTQRAQRMGHYKNEKR